jgi:hypothetical protein
VEIVNTLKENTMKKLIASVLLLPVLVLAQEPVVVEKPIICAKTAEVLNGLRDQYKELPIWVGEDDKSRYSLFVSKEGSWTLLQFNKEIACILGVGEKSREIFQGPKT